MKMRDVIFFFFFWDQTYDNCKMYLGRGREKPLTQYNTQDGSHCPPARCFPFLTLFLMNFQPLEVVSRYRDPQLQVAENYLYLFNLTPNICKLWCLNTLFNPNNSFLIG